MSQDWLSSRAEVRIVTPDRWAKQLVSHLGRKTPPEETPQGWLLFFGEGRGLVSTTDDAVVLVASGPDDEVRANAEDVLARHLVRFAHREDITVEWSRD